MFKVKILIKNNDKDKNDHRSRCKSEQFSSVIINMDVRIIDYQDVVGFALWCTREKYLIDNYELISVCPENPKEPETQIKQKFKTWYMV